MLHLSLRNPQSVSRHGCPERATFDKVRASAVLTAEMVPHGPSTPARASEEGTPTARSRSGARLDGWGACVGLRRGTAKTLPSLHGQSPDGGLARSPA